MQYLHYFLWFPQIYLLNSYDSRKIFPSFLYGSRKILSFFTLVYFANKATGAKK